MHRRTRLEKERYEPFENVCVNSLNFIALDATKMNETLTHMIERQILIALKCLFMSISVLIEVLKSLKSWKK